MNMKRILQAMDDVTNKPVEGADSMAKFLRVVREAEINQPTAPVAPTAPALLALALSPEQLAYNHLRAQLDGVDAMRGGSANTYTDVSPEVTASTNAMRIKLTQMASALKVKGIDAAAEYDAPDPAAAAAPVDLDQKYATEQSGMSRFLSIISEGQDLSNRTTAESIVMQHHVKPEKAITSPVLNVQENARPSMIGKYFKAVEEELQESAQRRNFQTRKLAERVTTRLNELSTATLANYKKAAGADAKKADADGDYARGDQRFKGIVKATNKQFDNDLKKHKDKVVAEATGDKPFDSMMTTIKKGTAKQATQDRKAEKEKNQQQARAAFGNMFGSGNPADKLKIREQGVAEKWSTKYKSSISCSHPKGFSQKAHCAGKKKHTEGVETEMTCPDCGMCKTHGSINEIAKGAKDSNGVTKCWPGKHAEGTKKGKNGGQVRNCVPNESVNETDNTAKKEGYGNHSSQRVDPRTGKQLVPPKSPLKPSVAEAPSTVVANVANRLVNKDDGKIAKLRAAGDKRREDQLKSRDIVRRDRTSKDEWGNLKQEQQADGDKRTHLRTRYS